jgi:hypothetical protein
MASIRERPTADGKPRYVVQFRQHGKQRTLTLTRKKDAEKARDLIDASAPTRPSPASTAHPLAPCQQSPNGSPSTSTT